MCGIAAVRSRHRRHLDPEVLASVGEALRRRGPDGGGTHISGDTALVHRRLAVIDLSEKGAQPILGENGTLALSCNGEVYNHAALRSELAGRGHRFRSESDCEVILRLYEESPDDLRWLERLRGMFAFVLHDAKRSRLVAARDRYGIKPLVVHRGEGFTAFASDLDALRKFPGVPSDPDWTSVRDFLVTATVPGPWTIFRRIEHVPPGTVLVLDDEGERALKFGEPAAAPPIIPANASQELERALEDSLRAHLVSDVEVGAFLSGGLDSGIIVAMASSLSGYPMRALSMAFPGDAVDEADWARETARRCGVRHQVLAGRDSLLDGLDEAVLCMDTPLGITSAVSLHALSVSARRDLKVVLTGDGADEILAGYGRHRPAGATLRALAWLPVATRPAAGRAMQRIASLSMLERLRWARGLRAAGGALRRTEAEMYLPTRRVLSPEAGLALLPAGTRSLVDDGRTLRQVEDILSRCPHEDRLNRLLHVDLRTSLVDEMLTKTDRMTAGVGLEARVPFLDASVVDVCMRMAGRIKRRDGIGKRPLRELVARRMGEDVAGRAKRGFSSPLESWIRTGSVDRQRWNSLWSRAMKSGLVDATAAKELHAAFDGGEGVTADALFAVVVLGLWGGSRNVCAA